jgi:hypothetical protein
VSSTVILGDIGSPDLHLITAVKHAFFSLTSIKNPIPAAGELPSVCWSLWASLEELHNGDHAAFMIKVDNL